VVGLHRQAGVATARSSHRPMTIEEVRHMSASGLIDVGAHTVTHPVLSDLTCAEQKVEIERSRDECYNLTGRRPLAFAYPYGNHDAKTVEIVRDAGFTLACTSRSCVIHSESEILRMGRMAVGAWNAEKFSVAMNDLARSAQAIVT
jgi:peptidoglycan/xylan/chitin deacetylase (PgdA/CDA1 family)